MMRLLVLLAAAVATAASLAGGATGAPTALCVGGPHCYSTVQGAVDAAPSGATIWIFPGTYAGGISLQKNVTLLGVAAAATRLSGGGPVVTIGSATTTPTVSLVNLTITGGLATHNPQAPHCGPDIPTCGPGYADATSLGGGIEAFPGTTVTIARSIVTGNRSTPALATASVKATCPGPTPCPASFGDAAGIDNWGTMTLIDTTVSDNHASAVQSNGGGIATESGSSLTLLNSRVTGNSAAAAGAFGRFVSGGGIFVDSDATLKVTNSSIDGNAANLTSSIPRPYPLQNGETNQANAFGGGILLADGSTAEIRNSTLSDNAINVDNPSGEPFGADAAFCACGGVSVTLENVRVQRNSVNVRVLDTADAGPSGPSAFEIDNEAALRNVEVSGNSTNVTALAGDAGALGALLFIVDGTTPLTVTNASVRDNVANATAAHGAATIQGVGIVNNGPLTLTNVDVTGNRGTATGLSGFGQGGGIWNGQLFGGPDSPLTLVNSRVTRNVLSGSPGIVLRGGGIFTPGFPVTLTGSTVSKNTPDDCVGC
jgi:hypothetical protein